MYLASLKKNFKKKFIKKNWHKNDRKHHLAIDEISELGKGCAEQVFSVINELINFFSAWAIYMLKMRTDKKRLKLYFNLINYEL